MARARQTTGMRLWSTGRSRHRRLRVAEDIILFMTRMLLLLALVLSLCACSPVAAQHEQGVAIYLPAQAMSGRDVMTADLAAVSLQPEPVIAADDIVYYSAVSHDLVLEPAAIERLSGLKVPVQGLAFVICNGNKPLVAGAFWTPISSLSFEGLTINIPFGLEETRVHLYSGYPMVDEPMPNDPRDNPQLLDAFRRMGKLR